MTKIAIYGGTFAPVHIGHVQAANEFFKAVNPDKMLIIPTLLPPHKQITFNDNPLDRFNMLNLAFSQNPEFGKKIFISDYELTSPPPSYTVNTLQHFSAPNTKLFFLCGTDMFLSLEKWHKPSEIFSLATIAVIQREDSSPALLRQIAERTNFYQTNFDADIISIHSNPIEISSSEIRNGTDDIRRRFLTTEVYYYIKDNKLYET